MGSGPRSREWPRLPLGRRRSVRAVADRLPSSVSGGLLRVAPVLGRPLGLLRALAGGNPVGGGGEHRPSPPRLWWAAPWRRWAAEPESTVSGSVSRTGWAAPGRSGPASEDRPPVATAKEQTGQPAFKDNGRPLRMNADAGLTGPGRLRSGDTSATGRPNSHVSLTETSATTPRAAPPGIRSGQRPTPLRRSIPGQAVASPSAQPAAPKRWVSTIVDAAGGHQLRHAALLPRREAGSLLRVAPVLRRPLGLFRAALGRDTTAGPAEKAGGAAASRPVGPLRTGAVRWFAGRWPSSVDSYRPSERESRILEAVQSGVLEVTERRGKAPSGRGANGAAPAGGMSSWPTPGRTNALPPSSAGAGPSAAGRRSASTPPTTLRRRSSASAPTPVPAPASPPAPASAAPPIPASSPASAAPPVSASPRALASASQPGPASAPPEDFVLADRSTHARDSVSVRAGRAEVGPWESSPSTGPGGSAAAVSQNDFPGVGAAGRPRQRGRPPVADLVTGALAEARRARRPVVRRRADGDVVRRAGANPSGSAAPAPSGDSPLGETGGTRRTGGAARRDGAGTARKDSSPEDEIAAEQRWPSAGAQALGPVVRPAGVGSAPSPQLMTARAVASRSIAANAPGGGLRRAASGREGDTDSFARPVARDPASAATARTSPAAPGRTGLGGGLCSSPIPAGKLRRSPVPGVRGSETDPSWDHPETAARTDPPATAVRVAGIGTIGAPRLVTARSLAPGAVVVGAASDGRQPAGRHRARSLGWLRESGDLALNDGDRRTAARAATESRAGTRDHAQPVGPSASSAVPAPLLGVLTSRPAGLIETVRRRTASPVADNGIHDGPPAVRRASRLPGSIAVANVAPPGANPDSVWRAPAHVPASGAEPAQRGTPLPAAPTRTSGATLALLTAQRVASWGPPGVRPTDPAGTVVHRQAEPASAHSAPSAHATRKRSGLRPRRPVGGTGLSVVSRGTFGPAAARVQRAPQASSAQPTISSWARPSIGVSSLIPAPPAQRWEAAAAGQVPPPSGGHRLPPLAPRVVVRQAPGAALAVEAAPGAQSVQRTWQSARPGPSTSESAMSASSVLSEHRRRTTAGGEDAPPRPTRPAPSLPGGGVNGGGPSTSTGVSAATPAAVDLDRLIEAIEERVLAEIERRGGRYTGLF